MRKYAITRTLTMTKCTAKCIDNESMEPFDHPLSIVGKVRKPEKMLAIAKKLIETDDVTVIQVTDITTKSALYGCTVEAFESVAEIIKESEEE